MTDATIPAPLATTIENDASAVLGAAEAIDPKEVAKVAAWYSRYAKGVVVTIGVTATALLLIFPPDGPVYHYAGIVAGAVTIIGVIAKRNAA